MKHHHIVYQSDGTAVQFTVIEPAAVQYERLGRYVVQRLHDLDENAKPLDVLRDTFKLARDLGLTNINQRSTD